jgi:hypothetical protein
MLAKVPIVLARTKGIDKCVGANTKLASEIVATIKVKDKYPLFIMTASPLQHTSIDDTSLNH